jgi:hypothetical protein
MGKLTPKIILEGTRLTHKTDLAFMLNEHPRIVGPRKYQYHSPLISGEWCTFTNYPWGRGLINFEPQEAALAMETYRTWVHLLELQRYYSWIIDRFHLSTQVYQGRQGRFYDFAWLEERLKPLNFCIVLCTRTRDSFYAAREERLKISGNPSQYDNLEPFIEEQEKFRDSLAKSILPHLVLDVTDDNLPALAEQIADWMTENNLLEMAD